MKKLWTNISAVMISKIIRIVLMLISAILVSRYFGPAGKGIFALIATLPILIVNLGNLGITNANIFLVSKEKQDERNIFYNSFWLGLALSVFFVIIFILILNTNSKIFFGTLERSYILMIVAITPFVLMESFFQGILTGKKDFKTFNVGQIISYSLIVAGVIIGKIFFDLNIYYVVILTSLSLIAPCIIYFFVLLKQFGLKWHFDLCLLKQEFVFGFRAYLASVMTYLILRSDIYLVNYFLEVKDVGLYSVAVNFSDTLLLIANAVAVVLFPQIIGNLDIGLRTMLKAARLVSLSTFLAVIVSYVFARPAINTLFGVKFYESLPSLYILIPASFFWALTIIMSLYLASKGFPWITVWIWLPGLMLNILINIIFIPRFGLIVAPSASLISYLLTFCLHFYYISKYDKIKIREVMVPYKQELTDAFCYIIKIIKN